MESAVETTIAFFIFLLVMILALYSVMNYTGAISSSALQANLKEYASLVKNKIIEEKNFYNPSTNPSYYGISSSSIWIHIILYNITIDDHGYPLVSSISFGEEPPRFIDKAESIGAYVGSSLILVRVIVYGLP